MLYHVPDRRGEGKRRRKEGHVPVLDHHLPSAARKRGMGSAVGNDSVGAPGVKHQQENQNKRSTSEDQNHQHGRRVSHRVPGRFLSETGSTKRETQREISAVTVTRLPGLSTPPTLDMAIPRENEIETHAR